MMIKNKNKYNTHIGLAVLATMVLTFVVSFFDVNTFLYKVNVLDLPEHQPFDGTVAPIKEVPNWVKLSSEKWDYNYDELESIDLVSLPFYDPNQLSISTDTLKWGDATDDGIRNAKITYSVPYMGNYKLDGQEYVGSHLAVDIKIPMRTPIYAIANGTVIKASTQSSGFGNHIVVQHNNFPTLNNPDGKEVIYSSYSHLDDVLVDVGDVVEKGDQIGLSGISGTATTPHLHFQIDNDEAPWHPFWPFTWTEISEAGLDFFSAINEGFGQDKAIATTINPMKYVQEFNDGNSNYYDVVEVLIEENVSVEETVPEEAPAVSYVEEEASLETYDAESLETTEESSEDQRFSDVPESNEYFEAIEFLAQEEIIQGYEDGTFKPDQTVNRVEALKFILEAINADLIEGELPFTDTPTDAWYVSYLFTGYDSEIVDGNPDGSFRPADPVNMAEFFKILFNGMRVDINPQVDEKPYKDVEVTDWYAPYISYAKEIGLLDGGMEEIHAENYMSRGDVAEAMYKLMQMED